MGEVYDDVFGCFVPDGPVERQPELTESELDEIAEKADIYYLNIATSCPSCPFPLEPDDTVCIWCPQSPDIAEHFELHQL